MKRSHIVLIIVVVLPLLAGLGLHQMVKRVRVKTAAAWEGVNLADYAPITERQRLEHGAALYGQFCARCHFTVGQGGTIGPAIDGKKWQQADDFAGLCQVIAEGRPNTPMIAWKNALSPDEVVAVASYLWTREQPPQEAPVDE